MFLSITYKALQSHKPSNLHNVLQSHIKSDRWIHSSSTILAFSNALSFLSNQNNRQIIYSSCTCYFWMGFQKNFANHFSHASQFGATISWSIYTSRVNFTPSLISSTNHFLLIVYILLNWRHFSGSFGLAIRLASFSHLYSLYVTVDKYIL